MYLQMIGIDYHQSGIPLREWTAFSEERAEHLLSFLCKKETVLGAVLLSTCNRTELYLHTTQNVSGSALFLDALDEIGLSQEQLKSLSDVFHMVTGDSVIQYLMEVSCGIHSQIFGEDQIITQVKQAWARSHEMGMTDPVLERLFQSAVTAAKRAKSECRLTGVRSGASDLMVEVLKKHFDLKKCVALVIGNGEMGRAAAKALIENGSQVTMTVRHYKTREVVIPAGCQVIDYCERYQFLPKVNLVVSATRSPHLTLNWTELSPYLSQIHPIYFVDLAVPRDLPTELAEAYPDWYQNIDTLGAIGPDQVQQQMMKQVYAVLKEEEEDFKSWCSFRLVSPKIYQIADQTADDLIKRLEKTIRRCGTESETLCEAIHSSAVKSVASLFFHAQSGLTETEWDRVLDVLLKKRENL